MATVADILHYITSAQGAASPTAMPFLHYLEGHANEDLHVLDDYLGNQGTAIMLATLHMAMDWLHEHGMPEDLNEALGLKEKA